jgi:HK97 family phage portal protein
MKQRTPGFIKSALASWLFDAYPFPAGAGDGIVYNVRPFDGAGGSKVILRLSAVWACVRLLAETISTLPLGLYERMPNGDRRAATEHPLYELLHNQPNADMTAQTFWEVIIASLLLRGNAFAEKMFLGTRLVALNFLDPRRMSWTCKLDGSMEFRYVDATGKMRVIPEHRMFHTLGFTTDGKMGLSVISYGASVFRSALSAQSAANSTFEKGLMPTVGFKMKGFFKKEQRKEFREDFLGHIGGAMNAGKPFILENEMDAVSIGINPTDAQLLESRAFSVEEICRWFRVPPVMVGHGDKASSWPTSTEAQGMLFLTFALRPWLGRIEQSIRRSLLTPAEKPRYFAEFAIEGLLRADSAARSAFYASALQNGWMNRTTVAKLENLPPIPGGDVYTVQSNLIPIDKLGQADAGSNVQDALKAFLGITEKESA